MEVGRQDAMVGEHAVRKLSEVPALLRALKAESGQQTI